MKHKEKVKLARRLRTPSEQVLGVGLFSSKEWMKRKIIKQAKNSLKNKNVNDVAKQKYSKLLSNLK